MRLPVRGAIRAEHSYCIAAAFRLFENGRRQRDEMDIVVDFLKHLYLTLL